MIIIGLSMVYLYRFIYTAFFYLRRRIYIKKDVIIMAYSKKSQETYRKKSLHFTCSYRPGTDLPEGQRLKTYLAQTGQSANAYIKALIRRDLDAQNVPYPVDNEGKAGGIVRDDPTTWPPGWE